MFRITYIYKRIVGFIAENWKSEVLADTEPEYIKPLSKICPKKSSIFT